MSGALRVGWFPRKPRVCTNPGGSGVPSYTSRCVMVGRGTPQVRNHDGIKTDRQVGDNMAAKSEFRQRLEDAVGPRHTMNHPLFKAWSSGDLSAKCMAGYMFEVWHYVSHIYPAFLLIACLNERTSGASAFA